MIVFLFFLHIIFRTLERTLISVLRATKDVQDWSLLALLLGVNERDYNSIMKETRDVTGQRKAIIKKWLETGKASWAILVSGLKDELIGLGAIGNKIAKDHPSKFSVNYIAIECMKSWTSCKASKVWSRYYPQ